MAAERRCLRGEPAAVWFVKDGCHLAAEARPVIAWSQRWLILRPDRSMLNSAGRRSPLQKKVIAAMQRRSTIMSGGCFTRTA